MYAVVLAGGQGTRLRPVISDVPKPLAPIGGRPFISCVLDLLERHGVRDVILAVGYLHERITEALGERHGAMRLQYAVEEKPLGTGGGLRNALRLVGRFPAFALNGDTFLDLDLSAMLAAHRAAKSQLTLALRRVSDAARYSSVAVRESRITGFQAAGRPGPGLVSAGFYLFAENLLERPGLAASFSFEHDFLEPRLAELQPLAFETDAYFIDIGIPADYARAQQELPHQLRTSRRMSQ